MRESLRIYFAGMRALTGWSAFAIGLVLATACATACGAFGADEDGPPSPDASADGASDAAPEGAAPPDAAADDASADDAGACPTGHGPSMRVTPVSASRSICIDRTEVTSAQYASFRAAVLDLKPLRALVPNECSPQTAAALSPADGGGDLPRVDVSFCSAAFYCAAQGKRLCGGLADGKGIVTDGGKDPPLEWEGACANGNDGSFYPWGTISPEPAVAAGCHTRSTDPNAAAPRAVGAAPACGPDGAEGPWDMIGNVWEWVNVRSDPSPVVSYTGLRGGSFEGDTVGNGCATPHAADGPPGQYATGRTAVGFRCCADPR